MSDEPRHPDDAPLPPELDPRRGSPRGLQRRPDPLPEDAPLPRHLDPRGRRGRGREEDVVPASAGRGDGTARREGRGRRTGLRVLAGVAALLMVLVAFGVIVLVRADHAITRVSVPTLAQGPDGDGAARDILLVGSDSREGLTPAELAEAHTTLKGGGGEGVLTDTLEILHLPTSGPPVLVSIPRDSWVAIPGHGHGRINSAYQYGETERKGGGPALLVTTVEQLTGIHIDHYVQVGFIAFLRITNAVGGIEVNLCAPAKDSYSGIDLPAGPQELRGSDALAFVRQRHGLPRGDLDRQARQQYFLGQAARQALSPSTLLRPDRLSSLAQAVGSSLTADDSLGTLDLVRLAWRLKGVAHGGLRSASVPVANANAHINGADVILLDDKALPSFFAGLDGSSAAAAPVAPTTAPSKAAGGTSSGTASAGASEAPAPAAPASGSTAPCVN